MNRFDLRVAYGDFTLAVEAAWDAPRAALFGPSGSGKTTLGRCVLRLIEPTVGRVVFDGRDITSLPPAELRALRRRMPVVFQNPYASLDPNMSAREVVARGTGVSFSTG